MFTRILVLTLGAALVAAGAMHAGDEKEKKGKKAGRGTRGIVVAVEKGKDRTILTIKSQGKKKDGQEQEGTEVKFTVTSETKYEKIVRVAKGETKRESATLADVHKGDVVTIAAAPGHPDVAKTVGIMGRKKGGKGK